MAHWTGDDRATAGTSGYSADVSAASLRSDGGNVSITFTSAQTWDCTSPTSFAAADISTSDMTAIQVCDDSFGFGSGENGGGYTCYNIPKFF